MWRLAFNGSTDEDQIPPESPTDAVTMAVGAFLDTNIDSYPPLFRFMDGDALNAVLDYDGSRVEFRWGYHHVEIDSEYNVTVVPRWANGDKGPSVDPSEARSVGQAHDE